MGTLPFGAGNEGPEGRAQEKGEIGNVEVWGDPCVGVDQGGDAADWFSTYLGTSCRLLYFKPDFVRPVDPDYAPSPGDQVGFADGFPLLMISEASLADLNARLAEPIRMNRFRPNIVVADCPPYAEDTWKRVRAGDLELDLVKPCGRCATTLVEQESGIPGKEPLKTLSTYRRLGGPSPLFGSERRAPVPGLAGNRHGCQHTRQARENHMSQRAITMPAGRCYLGFARIDITPPAGINHRSWGAAKHDASTGVHRPLTASALVFLDPDLKAEHVLVSLELAGCSRAICSG